MFSLGVRYMQHQKQLGISPRYTWTIIAFRSPRPHHQYPTHCHFCRPHQSHVAVTKCARAEQPHELDLSPIKLELGPDILVNVGRVCLFV